MIMRVKITPQITYKNLTVLIQNLVKRNTRNYGFTVTEKWFSNTVNYIIENYKYSQLQSVCEFLKMENYHDAQAFATSLVNHILDTVNFGKIKIKF